MINGILPAQIVADIIIEEMSLPEASVWLRDQNAEIPNDQGLYIVVGMVQTHTIASVCYIEPMTAENWDQENQVWDVGGQQFDLTGQPVNYDRAGEVWDNPNQTFDQLPPTMVQISEVQTQEMIQIEVLSRSNDALTRNWEVIAAIKSIYAQQMQEVNNFSIARLPLSFLNTSSAEGGSDLNRYTLTFPAFVWYTKAKVLVNNGGDYYDDFSARVDDEKTIATTVSNYDANGETFDQPGQTYDQPQPLVEFEINQEGIEP